MSFRRWEVGGESRRYYYPHQVSSTTPRLLKNGIEKTYRPNSQTPRLLNSPKRRKAIVPPTPKETPNNKHFHQYKYDFKEKNSSTGNSPLHGPLHMGPGSRIPRC